MKLKGKVAVIVGGGNGIGRRTSKLFAQEGAKILIADIDIDAAVETANNIRAMGYQDIETFKVDHTKEEEAFKMVKYALDKFKQIDILANIAGTHGYIEGGKFIRKDEGPFAESTKALWDSTIDINLNGARNCIRAVVGHMIERHQGRIINFSSVAAFHGAPGLAAYSAAKGGIISLTKALAVELAPYGILINCVIPSATATEQVKDRLSQMKQSGMPVLDMSQFASPEELANVVLWLASDDVSHMSGQSITMGMG